MIAESPAFRRGEFVNLNEQDLLGRQFARRRPDEMAELKEILNLANLEDNYSVQANDDGSLTFYGAELRDSICASEILNECFISLDRRISVNRIADILARDLPENWIKSRRKTTVYGDQPNTYVRTAWIDEPTDKVLPAEQSEPQISISETSSEKTVSETTVTVNFNKISSIHFDEEEFLTDKDFNQRHEPE